MISKLMPFIFLISTGLASASDCKSLYTDLLDPNRVFKQFSTHGDRSVIIWPLEERVGLDPGVNSSVAKWIEKFVRNRIFDQFELLDRKAYNFPFHTMIRRDTPTHYASITVERERLKGVYVYTLSKLQPSSAKDYLEKISSLSRGIQNNWMIAKSDIRYHGVLSDYLSVASASTKNQIGHLLKDPEARAQIENLAIDAELVLQSAARTRDEAVVNEPRRFVFYKNKSGVVFLLAYTIYKD